jgi:hypothetical protein
MNDTEMYKILEDFANGQTVARDIEVRIYSGHTSYTPRFPATSFKHEDAEYLSELVRGATNFMFWLRREGKARLVKAPRKGIKLSKSDSKKRKQRR